MSEQHRVVEKSLGLLIAFVGPSGVGKSSLGDRLLDEFSPKLRLSVSYTTRSPRGGEQDGVDYFFVTKPRFEAMIEEGAFIEHAHVHGNLYGTAIETVRQARIEGYDLLFDIDYQGAAQLKAVFPDTVGLMIAPPDMKTLEARLRGRKTDSEEVILGRLGMAKTELSQGLLGSFDYLVVNGDMQQAYDDVRIIYKALQLRMEAQERFLRKMLRPDA